MSFAVDTCLLGGPRAAVARLAALDLLCRRDVLIPAAYARQALRNALQSSARLDADSLQQAMESFGLANSLREAAGVPTVSSEANTKAEEQRQEALKLRQEEADAEARAAQEKKCAAARHLAPPRSFRLSLPIACACRAAEEANAAAEKAAVEAAEEEARKKDRERQHEIEQAKFEALNAHRKMVMRAWCVQRGLGRSSWHRDRTLALATGTADASVTRQSLLVFDCVPDAGTVPRSAVAVQAVWRGRKIREEKVVERGKNSSAILRDVFKAASRPLMDIAASPEPGAVAEGDDV
jgi:hypothetical protein